MRGLHRHVDDERLLLQCDVIGQLKEQHDETGALPVAFGDERQTVAPFGAELRRAPKRRGRVARLMLGGKDKNSDYRILGQPLRAKAHAALLIGAAAPIALYFWDNWSNLDRGVPSSIATGLTRNSMGRLATTPEKRNLGKSATMIFVFAL